VQHGDVQPEPGHVTDGADAGTASGDRTLTTDGPVSSTETVLSPDIPNLASMLRAAGYEAQYRGKWHLSKGPTGGYDVSPEDLAAYGFEGWVAPDAGEDTRPPNFGGGRADHDTAYIEQAVAFLLERAANDDHRPFCLVVALVNPHCSPSRASGPTTTPATGWTATSGCLRVSTRTSPPTSSQRPTR
jgi:arylsulfatase A-like enzyme